MIEEETVEIVHEKSQEAIFNWDQLLIASGGAFKPVKCFFYLISFAWTNSGTWKYQNNEEEEEYAIAVPMPDGSMMPIENLVVNVAKETLGVWMCPTGDASAALKAMKEKAQCWVDCAKKSKLHTVRCILNGLACFRAIFMAR